MRVRVNVKTTVNNAAIRREQRNGREVIIVPSTTMPDGIVMNGIKYPAEVIRASYNSLDRTPAPYGHPELEDGTFLSASDPEGLNRSWIGAWNENVRQEKDEGDRFRVHLDKVIDVEVAKQSEKGQEVLNAIDKGEPVHTSTGLYCHISECNEEGVDFVASDVEFDHDAILLHETGAATPEQGVGMMVNAEGKPEEIKVFNSMLEMAEQEMDWAAMSVLRALETKDKASMVERIKSAISEAISSMRETTPTANKKDSSMDKEQFEALQNTVASLATSVEALQANAVTSDKIAETVASAVKPLTDQLAANQASAKAKEEAELAGYVETIVKANLLSEETAKGLTLNTAKDMAERIKPGAADAIAAGHQTNSTENEFDGYDMNSNLEA